MELLSKRPRRSAFQPIFLNKGYDATHRARRIDNTPYARVNSGFLPLSERAIRTLFFIIAEDRRFFATFLGCESHSHLVLASMKRGEPMTRDDMERRCLELLLEGRPIDASSTACMFEANQVPPRGLNVRWDSPGYQAQHGALFIAMFAPPPAILGELTPQQMLALQVRAAMIEVTGGSRLPKRFLLEDVPVGNMNADAAARMILFAAQHRQQVEQLRQSKHLGVVGVEILAAPDSCEFCAPNAGKRYRLGEEPVLPHPLCTHKMGCRCDLIAVFEDDLDTPL
jgi:hypothetical protein